MDIDLLQKLAISLGLGLLVGMQREHRKSQLAGIRTFALATVFGSVAALLGEFYSGWVVAAGLLGIATMITVANYSRNQPGQYFPGQTTEIALLLMFGIGAYLIRGSSTMAVVLGAGVAVLLQLKSTLHGVVHKMGDKDIKAIMQFALISLVVLPVLPNQDFGPYQVLNPHDIWLMVVLIVGLGLLGYFTYKILGERAGTVLGGILGGLISSTATTVGFARRTKDQVSGSWLTTLVVFIASTVALIRVLVEIAVIAPGSMGKVAPPFTALILLMLVMGGILYLFNQRQKEQMPEQGNPAQMKTALVFGLIYGAVILATAAARDYLGASGLFIVAVVSGLTDVDAITLSTAQLMRKGTLPENDGWRVILVAVLSNLTFKAGLVGVLGHRSLFAKVAGLFGVVLVFGLVILWLWPAGWVLFL